MDSARVTARGLYDERCGRRAGRWQGDCRAPLDNLVPAEDVGDGLAVRAACWGYEGKPSVCEPDTEAEAQALRGADGVCRPINHLTLSLSLFLKNLKQQ